MSLFWKSCTAAVMSLTVGLTAEAVVVDFETFNIRNSNSSITSPWDVGDPVGETGMFVVENVAGDGMTVKTNAGGQKMGYGTNALDGLQVNKLESINYNVVRATASSKPYLNLWVSDGTNYAILAVGGNYLNKDFGSESVGWLLYEYDTTVGIDWLFKNDGHTNAIAGHLLKHNSANITLSQIADGVTFQDPGSLGLDYDNLNGGAYNPLEDYINTGAPRGSHGLNIIYGDTQSNYIGLYEIDKVTVVYDGETFTAGKAGNAVPEPATMALAGLAGMSLLRATKRRRA